MSGQVVMSMPGMLVTGASRRYRRAVMRRVWVTAVHGGALAYAVLVVGAAAGGLLAAAGFMLGIAIALATVGLTVAAAVDGALGDAGDPQARPGPGHCSWCGHTLAQLGPLAVCERCDCLPGSFTRRH